MRDLPAHPRMQTRYRLHLVVPNPGLGVIGHDPLRNTTDLNHVEAITAPSTGVTKPWISLPLVPPDESRLQGLNPPPPAYKAGALPTMS